MITYVHVSGAEGSMKVEHVYLLMAYECDRKYLLAAGKGLTDLHVNHHHYCRDHHHCHDDICHTSIFNRIRHIHHGQPSVVHRHFHYYNHYHYHLHPHHHSHTEHHPQPHPNHLYYPQNQEHFH